LAARGAARHTRSAARASSDQAHQTEEAIVVSYRVEGGLSARAKLILLATILAAVALGKVVYAQLVYDDWTCAIAHCVKVR
jgi:hypothetical protein